MKKITYIGALPSGHIEHEGKRYPFKRGETIEVPESLAAAKYRQEPNDWRAESQETKKDK